jgi:hypothetical protein
MNSGFLLLTIEICRNGNVEMILLMAMTHGKVLAGGERLHVSTSSVMFPACPGGQEPLRSTEV